ncbi:MAG: bifunctional metallophosphatase/5'-nucleotidase, partial [Bacteroidales bacterium]
KPTVILDRDGLKIGFIGLGVNPEGLIAKKNFGDIKYLNPSETANKYASELKKAGCDLIVVVSHIGYFGNEKDKGDWMIASNSKDIDLIIGGHSHTDLKGCIDVPNAVGKSVRVSQAGKSGFIVGRIQIELDK